MNTQKSKPVSKKKKYSDKIPKDKILKTNFFVPNKNFEWSKENNKSFSNFDNLSSLYEVINKEKIPFNKTEYTRFKPKKSNKEYDYMKCKQVRIYPKDRQKEIILDWIEKARIVYNIALNYAKQVNNFSYRSIRNIVIDEMLKPVFRNKLYYQKEGSKTKTWIVPCEVIRSAIEDVCKSYDSSLALKKAGYIKSFNIKPKSKHKLKQTILISSADFNKDKNTFYSSYLLEKKEIISKTGLKKIINVKNSDIIDSKDFDLTDIHNIYQSDVRLTYNTCTKVFMLNIPVKYDFQKEKISEKKFSVCGIDPGLKTFMTIYNPEGYCEKIFNRDITKKLNFLVNRKLKLNSLENKQQKHYKALKKINYRIECFRYELHHKVALYLCSNYNEIYLGKLSTQAITKRKSSKLSPFDKLYAYALGHCKFRTFLENKAREYNIKLNIVKEHFTSKTCGVCAHVKEIKKDREYICLKCNSHLDRDLNGARNILLKHC